MERGDGTFDANWGPLDASWSKTQTLPMIEWNSKEHARRAHGYTMETQYPIDDAYVKRYLMCKEKIDKLFELKHLMDASDLKIAQILKSVLFKHGAISTPSMRDANKIYKRAKEKQRENH